MDSGPAAAATTRSRPSSRSPRAERPKRLWVLDADLAGAFDRIAHDHILAMLGTFPARGMIRAVVEGGRGRATVGCLAPRRELLRAVIVSPVLLNIALHGMERSPESDTGADNLAMKDSPVLIRYADDFVVHCHTRQEALEVKAQLAKWLAPRGLAFNEDKTRVVTLARASTSWGSTSAATATSC